MKDEKRVGITKSTCVFSKWQTFFSCIFYSTYLPTYSCNIFQFLQAFKTLNRFQPNENLLYRT